MTPFFRPPWTTGAAFVFGLCLGSFANVCIARIPLRASIVWPGSHCPSCGARIRAWDNLPLLSYLILLGRCRSCRARISFRYPVVELLVGLWTAAVWTVARSPWEIAHGTILGWLCIALGVIDLEHLILPDRLTLPGAALGGVLAGLLGLAALERSLVGALLGGGSLYLIAVTYRWIRKQEGMGLGDAKFMALVGAFLGPMGAFTTLLVGSLVGSAVGVSLVLWGKMERQGLLPFGVFLSFGALASWMLPRIPSIGW